MGRSLALQAVDIQSTLREHMAQGRRFKSDPRNHQAEHLSGVQEALGARLDEQPSPFRKSQLGKPQITFPRGDTVEREMLWGDLAESLVANRTRSSAFAPIGDANVLEGLSQELPPEANISTQGLREATDEILQHRSIVMNLHRRRLWA